MAVKCKTCGAPQQLNDNKTCIYCGDTLNNESLNEELLLNEFVPIKYEFSQGHYGKVIKLSDTYLQKDLYNIPCWAYKITSELLKTEQHFEDGDSYTVINYDFGKLTSALKNLIDLKILNDISQEIIENQILRSLEIILIDSYNEKGDHSEFSEVFFDIEYENDIHNISNEKNFKKYLLFIEYCSEKFSNKFIENYKALYVKYFNLESPYFPSHSVITNWGEFEFNSNKDFTISYLSRLIHPINSSSELLIENYFNCITNFYKKLIKKSSKKENEYFMLLGINEPISYKPNKSSNKYSFTEDFFLNVFNNELEKLKIKPDYTPFKNLVEKYNSELKNSINELIIELNNQLNISLTKEKVDNYEDNAIFRKIFNIIFSIILFFYLCHKIPNTSEGKYPIGSALKIVIIYNILFFIGSYYYKKSKISNRK